VLSAPSKHAIRAVLCLAQAGDDDFVAVSDLAISAKVPAAYLSKLIKALAEHDIVVTRKGPGGGVKLNQKETTFYEICEVFQDSMIVDRCFLSSSSCNAKDPCPFHAAWSAERARIIRYLKQSKIRQSR
jgi:Rrf2 family protein